MAVGGIGTSAANKSMARDNKRYAAALSLRADAAAADSGTGTIIRCFADINREAEHRRAHSSRVFCVKTQDARLQDAREEEEEEDERMSLVDWSLVRGVRVQRLNHTCASFYT